MSDYVQLFFQLSEIYFRLFHSVCTRNMEMCRQQFLIQTCWNDWLVSMKDACSSASTGLPDRIESCLMERSGTIIRIIFSIIRIICLGWTGLWLCKYVLRTAFLCTPILRVTTSLWNIGEAEVAVETSLYSKRVESAQTVTIIRDYFALYHYFCDFFQFYALFHNQKSQSAIVGINWYNKYNAHNWYNRFNIYITCWWLLEHVIKLT